MKYKSFCIELKSLASKCSGRMYKIDENFYRVYGECDHQVFDVCVKRTKDDIFVFYYLAACKPNYRYFERDISNVVQEIFKKKATVKKKKICNHKHLTCNGLNSFICNDCGKNFDMNNASDDDKIFCLSLVYDLSRKRNIEVPESFISQFRTSKSDKLLSLVKTIDLYNNTVAMPLLSIVEAWQESQS